MAKLTEKAILQTFDDMIREMPFEKITVTALVARCEISSNTFYYHYRDIYDLLDQWLDIKMFRYPKEVYMSDEWKGFIKDILYNFQENPEVVKHILRSIPLERLEHYFFRELEEDVFQRVRERGKYAHLSEESIHMLSGIFCYSLCGFILKFLYDGMTADIDETFDPIINFLETSFANYVNQKSGEKEGISR